MTMPIKCCSATPHTFLFLALLRWFHTHGGSVVDRDEIRQVVLGNKAKGREHNRLAGAINADLALDASAVRRGGEIPTYEHSRFVRGSK